MTELWVTIESIHPSSPTIYCRNFASHSNIVKLDKYEGKSYPHIENCVPINPVTANRINTKEAHFSRTQIPKILKSVVNLGAKESNLGLTLFAISRAKDLNDVVVEPFAFWRLEKVNSREDLQDVLREMQRLHDACIVQKNKQS
jgi:hypothetical protein